VRSRIVLLALLGVCLPAMAAPIRLTPGAPLPQIARAGFDGRTVDLRAFRGKVVLIDFWASWCAPCIVEMPHLIGMQQRYRSRGLQVIGISMDDDPGAAREVARRFAFNYPLLQGDAKLGTRFGGILGLPVHMLAGRDGKILHIWTGEIAAARLEQAVAAAAP
jgi:cytochrome c biogenesis protein CcmG/thiol:disulfide interchange protein DsbE